LDAKKFPYKFIVFFYTLQSLDSVLYGESR